MKRIVISIGMIACLVVGVSGAYMYYKVQKLKKLADQMFSSEMRKSFSNDARELCENASDVDRTTRFLRLQQKKDVVGLNEFRLKAGTYTITFDRVNPPSLMLRIKNISPDSIYLLPLYKAPPWLEKALEENFKDEVVIQQAIDQADASDGGFCISVLPPGAEKEYQISYKGDESWLRFYSVSEFYLEKPDEKAPQYYKKQVGPGILVAKTELAFEAKLK